MLTEIMNSWHPPLRGEDGALLEQGPQTTLQARAGVSSSAPSGVPDEGGA